MGEAVANVRQTFGESVAWSRTFDHVQGHDGETLYVDTASGEMFDTLPRLNQTDGKPEDLPRKG